MSVGSPHRDNPLASLGGPFGELMEGLERYASRDILVDEFPLGRRNGAMRPIVEEGFWPQMLEFTGRSPVLAGLATLMSLYGSTEAAFEWRALDARPPDDERARGIEVIVRSADQRVRRVPAARWAYTLVITAGGEWRVELESVRGGVENLLGELKRCVPWPGDTRFLAPLPSALALRLDDAVHGERVGSDGLTLTWAMSPAYEDPR